MKNMKKLIVFAGLMLVSVFVQSCEKEDKCGDLISYGGSPSNGDVLTAYYSDGSTIQANKEFLPFPEENCEGDLVCKRVKYKAGGRRVSKQRLTFDDGSYLIVSISDFESVDTGDFYCADSSYFFIECYTTYEYVEVEGIKVPYPVTVCNEFDPDYCNHPLIIGYLDENLNLVKYDFSKCD